jgi:hypothetical protein
VKFLLYRSGIARSLASIIVTGSFILSLARGPEDYQKPIQGFQNAANTVIAADRAFLSHENGIEQNLYIDQQVFEQKPFGPDDPSYSGLTEQIADASTDLQTVIKDAAKVNTVITDLSQIAVVVDQVLKLVT